VLELLERDKVGLDRKAKADALMLGFVVNDRGFGGLLWGALLDTCGRYASATASSSMSSGKGRRIQGG
jgi:hypothetical protein